MQSESFKGFVTDQLGQLGPVRCRPMFGGYGLYGSRRGGQQQSRCFGILHKGRLFFKTDDRTRPLYVARGMKPFRPNAKQTLRTYYEVPVEVIEDGPELAAWAREALAVASSVLDTRPAGAATPRSRRMR